MVTALGYGKTDHSTDILSRAYREVAFVPEAGYTLESKTASPLSWNLHSSGDALPMNPVKTMGERIISDRGKCSEEGEKRMG